MYLKEEKEPSKTASVARRTLAASSNAVPIVYTRGNLQPGNRKIPKISGRIVVTDVDTDDRISMIRRRKAHLDRRRKRIKLFLATILGIGFPPILVVYLIAWFIWKNKPHQKSHRFVDRAIRSLEREQTGIALKQLQNAHFLDPTNSDALYWLGLLLAEQGRHEEAIEALSIVHERIPGMHEVEMGLMNAHFALRNHEETVYFAQMVLNRQPYDLPALIKLAESFAQLGQYEIALETLQRAPLFKTSLDDSLKRIIYRMGEWNLHLGNREKAIECFRRVYASDIFFLDVKEKLLMLEQTPSGKEVSSSLT